MALLVGLVLTGVALFAVVALRAARRHRVRRRSTTIPTIGPLQSAVGRYEIHQPNVNSPYTIDGKLAPPMRWKGPGPWFLIWDRQQSHWVDAAFTNRAAAERRLDELTNSVGVASRSRRRLALPPWRSGDA